MKGIVLAGSWLAQDSINWIQKFSMSVHIWYFSNTQEKGLYIIEWENGANIITAGYLGLWSLDWGAGCSRGTLSGRSGTETIHHQHQDGHNGNVLGHLQGWVCGGLARCLLQVVEVMTGHIQSTWKTTIFSFYCPGITLNSPSASFVYEWWWSPKPNIELMDFLLLAAPGLWTTRKNLSATACWFLLLLLKYHIALLCP